MIASLRLHRLLAGVVTHLPSLPAYPPSMLEDPAYLERLRPGHHLGCSVWCWLCGCRDEIPTSVSLQVCMHPWEARCLMWLLSSFVPCHLPFMFLSDPSCVPCREGIGSLGCRRLPPIRPPAPLGCLCLELGGVDWSVVHSPPSMQQPPGLVDCGVLLCLPFCHVPSLLSLSSLSLPLYPGEIFTSHYLAQHCDTRQTWQTIRNQTCNTLLDT